MSWEKDETGITFYCDTPDCNSVLTVPPGTDFISCWKDANARIGWVSFKRAGRPWDYFCPRCAADAATAHREYNRQEQERERIKARNSY